jgi:beta-lactamase regulating signal transducer with metallopeptidase domain
MSTTILSWLGEAPWMGLSALFINVALKGVLICAVAGIATLLLRRSSAFVRNMVWVFALVGLLLLPVFSLLSPLWNLPIIPELGSWGAGAYTAGLEKPEPEAFVGPLNPERAGATASAVGVDGAASTSIPWYAWGILAWIAGGLLYLLWCVISHTGVRLLIRQAHPADQKWNALFQRMAEEMDVQRNVRLLESSRIQAAITAGVINPVVVIPSDTDAWSADRRRLVLSHELAHVKRWDTLTETFALFATALYWFNPLVWYAVKQLRIERETDCDNAVLRNGAKPSDYAELLMDIAADLGTSPKPVWQLSTISQSSNLKDRLMNILNQKMNRNRGNVKSALLTGVLVLALVIPISAAGIWSSQPAPPDDQAGAIAQAQTDNKAQQDEKTKTDEQLKEEQMKKKAMKEKKAKMTPEEKASAMLSKVCENETSAACKVFKTMK